MLSTGVTVASFPGLLQCESDQAVWESLGMRLVVFQPPIATLPVRETSPVMAMFCRTGLSMARERRAETMVTPALGPSFGVAPWGGTLSLGTGCKVYYHYEYSKGEGVSTLPSCVRVRVETVTLEGLLLVRASGCWPS